MLPTPAFNGPLTSTLSPLPSPWTEHVAPTGHLYYYNPHTLESTWNRPLSLSSLLSAVSSSPSKPKKKKKEKPVKQTQVSDSEWLRILTNRGNVFFHNMNTKESQWDPPVELAELVEAMELSEQDGLEERPIEVKGEPSPSVHKRKLEDDGEEREAKRVKLEDAEDEHAQRQLLEEMATEEKVKGESLKAEEEKETPSIPFEEARELFVKVLLDTQINPLHPWELSLATFSKDERYPTILASLSNSDLTDVFEQWARDALKAQKAHSAASGAGSLKQTPLEAYQSLLKEKVTSTRTTYTQFRQANKKERRFYGYGRDEKERERVFRSFLKELGEKKKASKQASEEAFLTMLKEGNLAGKIPHGSKWMDIKKEFQKDPRYDAIGSSSLREELFDTFSKTLSTNIRTEEKREENVEEEKKRKREKAVKEREERVRAEKERVERENARSRAGLTGAEVELAFRSLLIDTIRDPTMSFNLGMSMLSNDARYTQIVQANQLSQRRLQSLFDEHISHLLSKTSTALSAVFESYALGLDKTWDSLSQSEKNSIANSSAVKRLKLDSRVTIPKPSPKDDESDPEDGERWEYPVLREEFNRWQRLRFAEAREAFDKMLEENAFVSFWGRVGKMGASEEERKQLGKVIYSNETGQLADDITMEIEGMEQATGGGDEGVGGRDLKTLAKGVDLKEMERVLRGDKRWRVFDYLPEEREGWLKEYVKSLAAPKASVHLGV